ncbi:MAG: Ig-like domain-containing protein [Pseudomonadota bacterium]
MDFRFSTSRVLTAAVALFSASVYAGGVDTDGDGVLDSADNCVVVANADQRDTDGDSLGNACDADLNQDCVVNVIDLGILRSVFFSSDENADFNGDGVVNVVDLGVLRQRFFAAPGPSGLANDCAPVLTIEGRVEAFVSDSWTVTATVDGTAAGGGQLVFSTSTGDGSYTLPVFGASDMDYVTLSASSASGRPVRLVALAGSLGALSAQAVADVVDESATPRVVVSSASSGLAIALEEQNGAPVLTDAQYDTALANAGPPTWLRLGALVQAPINQPAIALPAGAADTFDAVRDPLLRTLLRDEILLNFLGDRDLGLSQILAFLDGPFTEALVPGTYFLSVPDAVASLVGERLTFNADGSAGIAGLRGTGAGTWVVDMNGRLRADLSTPMFVSESSVSIDDPDNPGQIIQTPEQTFLDSFEVQRLIDGNRVDSVVVLRTTRRVYPEFPQLPPEIFVGAPDVTGARNMVAISETLPLAAADLSDQEIIMPLIHSDVLSYGTREADFGYDVFSLAPDGTGATERLGLAFAWSVSPEGVLVVDFDNGQTVEFTATGANGQVINGVVQGDAGVARTTNAFLLVVDRGSAFTLADVADARFRSALVTTEAVDALQFEVFDWNYLSDGTACRNPFSPFSQWFWSLDGGRIELDRTFTGNPDIVWRRSFETFGRDGDANFGIETLQVLTPEPAADPATVAGRFNIYTKRQSLAGNAAPTINPDFVTAPASGTTTFSVRSLLANDTDPEGDEIIYQTHTGVGSRGGALELVNVEGVLGLAYTPPAGSVAGEVETFALTVSDRVCPVPNGAQTTITVTIE